MINKPLRFILFIFVFALTARSNLYGQKNETEEHLLNKFNNFAQNLYLSFDTSDVDYQVFYMALKGYLTMLYNDEIENTQIITIVDYSKPSNKERMYIFDLKNKKILYHTYVAHAVNSGYEYPMTFSNMPGTNKSCYGFFVANEAYNGSNGYSLRLDGKEPKINHNARSRGIVIHGTNEVSTDLLEQRGYIGHSHGCISVAQNINSNIISTLEGKSCLFVYYPDENYIRMSKYLNDFSFLKYFSDVPCGVII